MGLFGSKNKSKGREEPVRRDQVLRLIKLGMAETDEGDVDVHEDHSPRFDKAKARMDKACGQSTKAEINAAYDALKRHGY